MKLFNKNFVYLLGSQLFSVFGAAITQFAISLYVLDKTGSMGIFSVVLSLSMLSRVVFLPLGGILADRLPKKKLMIVMDFLYLIMSIILAIGIVKGNTILIMAIISIVLGVVSSFETPVVQSAIPIVCKEENILQANGVINSIAMLSNLLAPAIAGIIYNFEKAYIAFIVSSIFFLMAVICEVFLQINQERKVGIKSKILNILKEDTLEVTRYLKNNKLIVKICTITFLLNLFISSFINVVIPFTARVEWNVSNGNYGIMNMLFAAGGLLGSILVSILAKKISGKHIAALLLSSGIIFSSLIVAYMGVFNDNKSFWIMTIITTILMAVFTMISVQLISYIQLITDKNILGRVMSFVMMLSMLAMPVGQIIFGALEKFTAGKGIIIIVILISLITLVISIFSSKIFNKVSLDKL